MNKIALVILIAASLISACSLLEKPPTSTSLNIRAYIDGRSQLVIHRDQLYWQHLDFDAPGRWEHGSEQQPTYLNGVAWQPVWPDTPDATNDFCYCSSSTAAGIPSLTRTDQQVELSLVTGRGPVSIAQYPTAGNDFTLIVELNDNDPQGADWYELNLNYLTRTSDPLSLATTFPPDPTPLPPPLQTPLSHLASISGSILGETSDPFLRVYARNVVSGEVVWVNPPEGSLTYTIPNLEPGIYVVVGWYHPMGASGAFTSLNTVIADGQVQMDACQEAIIRIELFPGDTFTGADIGCWGGDFFGLTE